MPDNHSIQAHIVNKETNGRYLCKRTPPDMIHQGGHSVASVVFLPNTHNPKVIVRKRAKSVSAGIHKTRRPGAPSDCQCPEGQLRMRSRSRAKEIKEHNRRAEL